MAGYETPGPLSPTVRSFEAPRADLSPTSGGAVEQLVDAYRKGLITAQEIRERITEQSAKEQEQKARKSVAKDVSSPLGAQVRQATQRNELAQQQYQGAMFQQGVEGGPGSMPFIDYFNLHAHEWGHDPTSSNLTPAQKANLGRLFQQNDEAYAHAAESLKPQGGVQKKIGKDGTAYEFQPNMQGQNLLDDNVKNELTQQLWHYASPYKQQFLRKPKGGIVGDKSVADNASPIAVSPNAVPNAPVPKMPKVQSKGSGKKGGTIVTPPYWSALSDADRSAQLGPDMDKALSDSANWQPIDTP